MRYFDHDTTARKDDAICALRIACGGAAVDAYWYLLEMIYETETELVLSENQTLTKSVTHGLGVGFQELLEYIETMSEVGLFIVGRDDENGIYTITSERAMSNIANYKARQETARQNGKKGGRKPKANQTLTKSVSEKNPTLTQPLTKEKEKEKEKEKIKEEPKGSKKFAPPTREEVEQFTKSNGLPLDIDSFFDHYESNGWKVGRNSMKDWRAAARRAARVWATKETRQYDKYN